MEGWVKLHRCLMDKAIWNQSSPQQGAILITLLMMANRKEKQWMWQGKKFEALPGQFVTSAESIIKNCPKGITRQHVRTAIERFKKLDFLTIETTKTGMLISIVNWRIYQAVSNEANQEANPQLTIEQPTANQQLTTNKTIRLKTDKNDKKNNYSEFVRLTSAEHERLTTEFGQVAVDRMIEILDNYKGSKGKKYLDDNRAIRNWVVKRYQEEQPKQAERAKTIADKIREETDWYAQRHGNSNGGNNERSIPFIEE